MAVGEGLMRMNRGRITYLLALTVVTLWALALNAQTCTVSVSGPSTPDPNGILTYTFDAHANTTCGYDVVAWVKMWLDVRDDAHTVSVANSNCVYRSPCSGTVTFDTYCWSPSTSHKLITQCSAACGIGPAPVDPAAAVPTGLPTPPSLSISYDFTQGLTRTYSFVPGHKGPLSIYIDGVYQQDYSGVPYYDSHTITGPPTVGVCSGDHTFTVYAQAC